MSASAELTQSIFDLTSAAGAQFFAMLLGAFLASLGGFSVAWVLDRMERKRQERSIALVCLDLLTSLGVLTKLAEGARGRGDPYGPLTVRLVRSCLRDLEVYERNRERVADISDPVLRAEIYECMARLLMCIEGILNETDIIAATTETIEAARDRGDAAKAEALENRCQQRAARRDASFDFMVETAHQFGAPLSAKLRVVAKSEAQNLSRIVDTGAPSPAPIPPAT
ncbi:MAG: hypothetical protein JNL06_09865 [Alphaproteobacteria bacterium]|nr:hypothetical protein [Alphaproteobacteria bacterium]